MTTSEVLALCLFSALAGGTFGNFFRLALRVPAWLFSD